MDPSLPPAPGAVPHSARALVEDLADRLGTSPLRLVLVALAAGAILVVGLIVALRPDAPPPELSIPYAEGAAVEGSGAAPAATSAPTTIAAEVLVHAAGAVTRPGVYALPSGSRVGDLLAAAGGPLVDADLDRLNLAAPVLDGSRVYVPAVGEEATPSVEGPDVASGAGSAGNGPVDLNTADEAALETLPGVGPATAAAIVAHREANGPFRSVEDLLDVRGIGDAKLDALRDLVTV